MRPGAIIQLCAVWGLLALSSFVAAQTGNGSRLDLHNGWEIQSSCKLNGATGTEISSVRYRPKAWIKTAVPSTVLAAQLANKLVPDPFYGMNLRSIRGADYPIGKNFSNLPMADDSPYRCSWWYRTEFTVPASFRDKHVALHFDGINYRANIWLNGNQIANSSDVAGTWRLFDFDVTEQLHREDGRKGGTSTNVVAVEVFAPTENDLALTWVDWAPAPPDKDMGLWRPVYLTASEDVSITHPYVKTQLDPDFSSAHLTIEAEVTNQSDHPIVGEVLAGFAPFDRLLTGHRGFPEKSKSDEPLIRQPISLAAHEQRTITFNPSQFPELNVSNPLVWWPAEIGESPLYEVALSFVPATPDGTRGVAGIQTRATFGIRQVTSELVNGQRLFRINGKPLLIRGGGWAPDLLLREDHARLEDQFRMTRDMGLNTIRLEGKLESDEFFDLADRYGILVMPGWCCCDMWEKWDKWTDETYKVATASLADQVRRLREHPSVFVWLNGSDNPPPPNVEQMYLDVLKKYDWPNPVVSSATARATTVTGPSGVKMNGPYDYVPPNYWLDDTARGGAFGFATEISPGPAIPPAESIARFMPPNHFWPAKDDEVWKYHSGGGQFANLNIYTNALDQRYGPATSLADFERKSQAAAYEGERAMFEGYTRNKWTVAGAAEHPESPTAQPSQTSAQPTAPTGNASPIPQPPNGTEPWPATGVIQWMLNNAWPSMIWHLYDSYLVPGGGYYGTKEATKPLHVQYSYSDNSVVVIGGTKVEAQPVSVTAETFTVDMARKSSSEKTLQVAADSVTPTGITIATDQADLGKTFFLRLQMKDAAGKLIDDNLYWLSTQPDQLDNAHATWYYTPETQYADLTGLNSLPQVKLAAAYSLEHHDRNESVRVHLRNPSKSVAFMVHLRVAHGARGQDIAPVFWEDNYVSIFPGEERIITGSFAARDLDGAEPVIEIDGWNVAPETLRPAPTAHPAAKP